MNEETKLPTTTCAVIDQGKGRCAPASIDAILAGIPTQADGVTCHLRDVRRVLEDNPHLLANAQAMASADEKTPPKETTL